MSERSYASLLPKPMHWTHGLMPIMPGEHYSLDWAALLHAVEYNAYLIYHGCLMRDLVATSPAIAAGLWEVYLANLPDDRKAHDCRACRSFIETYGGTAVRNGRGQTIPLAWASFRAPTFYQKAIAAMEAIVRAAPVAPFVSPGRVWGTPRTDGLTQLTGGWTHLAIRNAPYRRNG